VTACRRSWISEKWFAAASKYKLARRVSKLAEKLMYSVDVTSPKVAEAVPEMLQLLELVAHLDRAPRYPHVDPGEVAEAAIAARELLNKLPKAWNSPDVAPLP
jgi:hypothetical protein